MRGPARSFIGMSAAWMGAPLGTSRVFGTVLDAAFLAVRAARVFLAVLDAHVFLAVLAAHVFLAVRAARVFGAALDASVLGRARRPGVLHAPGNDALDARLNNF